ncbi:MAG: VOC family protein [Dehalococcoidia bacterium]
MATIQTIHHVALTVPTERLEEARRFYSKVLGLHEASRPEAELGRPGIWYRLGATELHIQCRDGGPPQDADYHPALIVDDVAGFKEHLRASGAELIDAQKLMGRERFFCRDPFGNRIEFMSEPS